MKSRIVRLVVALVALTLLSSIGNAQERLLFRVNVPFEFIAAGVHMPTGTYLAFHETSTIIKLVRVDGRASAWIAVKPSPVVLSDARSEIVFNKYGDTYFLSKVNTGYDQQVHECFRCQS